MSSHNSEDDISIEIGGNVQRSSVYGKYSNFEESSPDKIKINIDGGVEDSTVRGKHLNSSERKINPIIDFVIIISTIVLLASFVALISGLIANQSQGFLYWVIGLLVLFALSWFNRDTSAIIQYFESLIKR